MTLIAASSGVSHRTVRRYLDGVGTYPASEAAITRAAKELKIDLKPFKKAA